MDEVRVLLDAQVTVEDVELDSSSILLHESRNKMRDVDRMRMKLIFSRKYFIKGFFIMLRKSDGTIKQTAL